MVNFTGLNRCETTECPGHLGKYSSCRDEALDILAMDASYGDDTTGSTEFQGYLARVLLDEDENVDIGAPGPAFMVTVPPGRYLVHHSSTGFVAVESFESDLAINYAFNDFNRAYTEWLDTEEG